MNKLSIRIISAIASFAILLTSFFALFRSASAAWIAQRDLSPLTGTVMSGYFAGGNGTEENPYVISAPIHLYNLAWLQNTGRFNTLVSGQNVYEQFHFVLANDLDMTDWILPPIGTADNPFVGTFTSRGDNVYTISNLTVSNMLGESEIEKRPQYVTTLSGAEIIGAFGVVGKYKSTDVAYGDIIPSISNFRLKDATIRARTPNALAGLVCGYASGTLQDVYVEGGSIVSGQGNQTGLDDSYSNTLSKYALVGDISAEVFWDGVTNAGGQTEGDQSGGGINIFPSEYTNNNNPLSNLSANTPIVPVPNSAENRAFFVGNGDSFSLSQGKISTKYRYTQLISSNDANKTHALVPKGNNSLTISSQAQLGEYNGVPAFPSDVADKILNAAQQNQAITFDAKITQPSVRNDGSLYVTKDNGWVLHEQSGQILPANAIWFKPITAGICNFAFYVTNMKDDRHKSIYRYKTEKISETEYAITDWSEITISFIKTNGLKNSDLVCYQYEITKDDIGYEFAIGTPSNGEDDDAHFLLLSLAGSNESGAGEGDDNPDAASKPVITINFVPAGYVGPVAQPGMIITTFKVQITKNADSIASVNFVRYGLLTESNAQASTSGGITATVTSYTIEDEDDTT